MKKSTKLTLAILAGFAIFFTVVFTLANVIEKEFSCGALRISVGEAFKEDKDIAKYGEDLDVPSMVLIDSGQYVYVDREKKSAYASLGDYIDAIIELNDPDNGVLHADGFDYIEMTSRYVDRKGHYTDKNSKSLVAFYESDEYYWTVQIGTSANSYESRKSKFLKWAGSVHFVEE